MKKFKATWEKVVERYGKTIEGVVDWSLKYLRIYCCVSITLFVVLATMLFGAIASMARPYAKPKAEKEKAEQPPQEL